MSDNTLNDEKRKAYAALIELIQDAGYRVLDERYKSSDQYPEFDAKLTLIPPEFETLDVHDGTGVDHER